jgi:hypothetical protein
VLNSIVISEHVKAVSGRELPRHQVVKQARMGGSENIVVDAGKPSDAPMRVIVELVGEAAPPRVEQSAPQGGPLWSGGTRVQLVG